MLAVRIEERSPCRSRPCSRDRPSPSSRPLPSAMLAERDIERADVSSIPEIARHDWAAAVAGLVVADVMARDPLALHPETPVAEAARLARDRRADAFAVVDDGAVTGVVSRSDLLAVLSG